MKKTIAILIIAILSVFIFLPNYIYAENITSGWEDIYNNPDPQAEKIGGSFLGIAQIIGGGATIICLVIIAIKFMTSVSDPNKKAMVKEKLIPYVVGAVLFFSATVIIAIVRNFAQNIDTPGISSYNTDPYIQYRDGYKPDYPNKSQDELLRDATVNNLYRQKLNNYSSRVTAMSNQNMTASQIASATGLSESDVQIILSNQIATSSSSNDYYQSLKNMQTQIRAMGNNANMTASQIASATGLTTDEVNLLLRYDM